MKKLKEIRITLERVSTIEIVMNDENGYDMPKNSQELAELAVSIRNNRAFDIEDHEWKSDDTETNITSVEYIDEK